MSLVSCDPQGRVIEFDQYITPDGIAYDLHSPPVRSVISDEAIGLPPIEYTTERGPNQHGVTIKDHFLRPRIVQMVLRQSGFSRTNRWYEAGNLLSMLNPSRTVGWAPGISTTPPNQGRLRKWMPNGSHLDLDVVVDEGPKFEARASGVWDEWGYTETLRFCANNPLYYNPVQMSVNFAAAAIQLVFPATFPIVFGGVQSQQALMYGGNWQEFPSLVLQGPITNPGIFNHTTGEQMVFLYKLPVGRTLTVSLDVGNKKAMLDDGTNLLPFLVEPNDIATFHLDPDPLAPGGANQIQVTGSDVTSGSQFNVTWYNRYLTIQQI